MSKYRSKSNYADVYGGDRGGINLGLDGAIFLKLETTPRTFNPPAIGTQGKSQGAASASTDISAHATPATLKATVSGGAQVTASIAVAGLTSGTLIAAALETAINNALTAAGQDAQVWVEFDGGDDHYTIYNQSTGTTATVVIANGVTNNIADDLNVGLANGGTETAGTDDADFLLYTEGGPSFSQPIESNQHRSGRFHSGIVKAKKVVEWAWSTYINMSGNAGSSIDTTVKLLWKSLLGTETSTGSAIQYRQGLPNLFFSIVRCSTIFGEYYTGGYVKNMSLTLPGDGPGTCAWSGGGSDRTIAGIAQISGAVSASATVVVNADETDRYSVGAPVMGVAADGRTILAGVDGSLTIDTITSGSDTLVLSTTVTLPDDGFIVPWNPGAVQMTGRDAIYTDLEGSLKLQSSGSAICATNIALSFTNDHVDLSNCFGSDHNEGFAAANRLSMELSVTADLSNENFGEIVQSANFGGFAPEIILGATSGRYLQIDAAKWIPSVPPIELPQNGTTPVTLTGMLYQSSPGAQDPILVQFK